MSIKDLFEQGEAKILKSTSIRDLKGEIESQAQMDEYHKLKDTFVPPVDFATASNFAKFGSAESYYEDSIKRIYRTYPYDGSKKEKTIWENNSKFIDRYIFDELYPRTTGYVNIGQDLSPTPGGTLSDTYYVYPTSKPEYIFIKGGPNADPDQNFKDQLDAGSGSVNTISKANIWDHDKNRLSNLRFNPPSGTTVEFWMKKNAFAGAHSLLSSNDNVSEIIFDLWNSGSVTDGLGSEGKYGRFVIYVDKDAPTDIKINQRSGSESSNASLDTGLTTIADGNWHHYAVVVRNTGSNSNHIRLYVDGAAVDEAENNRALGEYTGPLVATLGAQITTMHGDSAGGLGYGKLSASIDEFRYWKSARDAKEIGRHWFTQVHGGTNSDNDKYSATSSVDLGVYYKFNEGIVEDTSVDSIVLDYSGRISNGVWTGYSSSLNARATGSAINENLTAVTASISEFRDPIIYSDHPDITSLLDNMKTSGSAWDVQNNASIYHSIPAWILEEDAVKSKFELKKLTQVIASYFDKLFLQIEHLPKLGNKRYFTGSIEKPHPFADVMMQSHGFPSFMGPELFGDADLLEQIMQRGEKKNFELSLFDIKNRIYQNIYNNLVFIYKSKGTEKSLRNTLRCYGIDDELIKINLYAGNETYEFKDTYRSTTVRKRYVDCNDSIIRYQIEGVNTNAYGGTIYQYPETGNPNSVSYISGAIDDMELSGTAITLETEFVFPKLLNSKTTASYDFPGNTISLFGMRTANTAGGTGSTDTTWLTSNDVAAFSVVARQDPSNPQYHSFILSPETGGVLPELNTGLLTASSHLYDNNKWNFALRLKPNNYPYINFVSGSNTKDHSIEEGLYWLELYGVNTFGDTVLNEFIVSSSLTTTKARQFLNAPKRVYAGAHRTNFSGAIVTPSNVKIGSVRYWLDYLDNEAVLAHARDATNYGALRPSKNAFFAQNSGSTDTPRNTMMHTEIPQIETLALNWNFDGITGSDSNGQFVINDLSSGSMALAHDFDLYGLGVNSFGNILKKQHTGRGDIFTPSTHKVIDKDWVYTAKQHLPEVLNSSDNITLRNQDDDLFVRDSDLIHFFFGIEKSMYQTISEEMLKMFATIKDFNNLIGDPVNQYRQNYKTLEKIRELFFARMGNTPDLDRYVDFYIWIDSAVTKMLEYLVPASANVSKLRTMVEDHILSRSKYINKFPTVDTKISDPEGKLKGIKELKYNWKDGHVPTTNFLALEFNGSDEYLSVADAAGLSFGDTSNDEAFSISAWVRPTELDNNQTYAIASKHKEYLFAIYVDGSGNKKLLWYLYDNSTGVHFRGTQPALPTSFTTNTWHNLVVTYDGRGGTQAYNGLKVYCNGDALTNANTGNGSYTAMHDLADNLIIGAASNGSGNHFTGLINDVMLFGEELDSNAVKRLANFSLPTYNVFLSWWTARQANSANVVVDKQGNPLENNATMNNMTTADNVVTAKFQFSGPHYGYDPTGQKNNCLWWKERAERGAPSPLASFNAGVDNSRVHIHNTLTTDTNVVSGTVPVLSSSFMVSYTGSTYVLRRLSIPYIFSTGKSLKIHGGPNLQHNQKYDFVFSSVSKRTGSSGQGLTTYLAISASKVDSSSMCQDYEIFDGVSGSDRENKSKELGPFKKRKLHFEASYVHDGNAGDINKDETDGLGNSYGHILANFNIYSSSADQDKYYATELSTIRLSGATITDLHHDVYGPDYEKPMQGPWVEEKVGGKLKMPFTNQRMQFKQGPNQLDNRSQRVESFTLVIDGNEINVHPGDYHSPHLQKSWILREGGAKRPVNIRNIPTVADPYVSGTNSDGTVLMRALLGNYSRMRNYEVVNTPGRSVNNLWIRSGSKGVDGDNFGGLSHTVVRPQGDIPLGSCLKREHTFAGSRTEESGSVLSTPETIFQVPGRRTHIANYPLDTRWGGGKHFGTSWGWLSGAIDFELPERSLLSGSPDDSFDSAKQKNRTVIAEKFSAPGGFEVMSRGYLDPAHETYSVYNALPYRNLSVRHGLQSGINLSSSLRDGKEAREALTGSRFSQLHEFMPQSRHAVDTAGVYEARNINLPHDISSSAYSGRGDSLLVRHCGQFGLSSRHVGTMLPDDSSHRNWEFGSASYDVHNRPSFHKIHRNNIEKLTLSGSEYKNTWFTELNTGLAGGSGPTPIANSYWVAPDHDDFSFGPDNSNDAPFSITAWVNIEYEASPGHRNFPIVAKISGSSYEWGFWKAMSTGKLAFQLFDNSAMALQYVNADSALPVSSHNKWIHVAAVYDHTGASDANAMKIYVNGQKQDVTPGGMNFTAMHNTAADVTVGFFGMTAQKCASGSLDEVAIWSHALSDQEILDVYQANDHWSTSASPRIAPGDLTKVVSSDPAEHKKTLYSLDYLTAWWRFGDDQFYTVPAGVSAPVANAYSQSIYDSSGNGHNLTGTIRATILQNGQKYALEYTASSPSSGPGGRNYDAVVTSSQFDNAYVTHQIPRTDQQYSWITSSLSV